MNMTNKIGSISGNINYLQYSGPVLTFIQNKKSLYYGKRLLFMREIPDNPNKPDIAGTLNSLILA
jgi:hypothetical protein